MLPVSRLCAPARQMGLASPHVYSNKAQPAGALGALCACASQCTLPPCPPAEEAVRSASAGASGPAASAAKDAASECGTPAQSCGRRWTRSKDGAWLSMRASQKRLCRTHPALCPCLCACASAESPALTAIPQAGEAARAATSAATTDPGSGGYALLAGAHGGLAAAAFLALTALANFFIPGERQRASICDLGACSTSAPWRVCRDVPHAGAQRPRP